MQSTWHIWNCSCRCSDVYCKNANFACHSRTKRFMIFLSLSMQLYLQSLRPQLSFIFVLETVQIIPWWVVHSCSNTTNSKDHSDFRYTKNAIGLSKNDVTLFSFSVGATRCRRVTDPPSCPLQGRGLTPGCLLWPGKLTCYLVEDNPNN